MRKTYIFDTSVLIDNPFAFKDFENSDIIIPIAVFNELDSLKKQPHERGRNARVCIKTLEEICLQGNINTGIAIDNNSILKIDVKYYSQEECAQYGNVNYGDTQILACLIDKYTLNNDTTLVSNDINLRIKARARGVSAISHLTENKFFHELYTGCQIIENKDASDELQSNLTIDPAKYNLELLPNECVIFKNEGYDVLGRKVSPNSIKLVTKQYPWGIKAKNNEQQLAIDMLMDPSIDLITISGRAGTGKSLVTFAAAIEQVINRRDYNRVVIYRPIQAVGNDVGFLPGELTEKLMYWFSAAYDTFDYLFSNSSSKAYANSNSKQALEMFQKKNLIEFGALTYIRGRSIPQVFLIVDEVQNINIENIKTVLTRIGTNAKIVLLGDIEQIDDPTLDANNNAMTHIIEKFKTCEFAAHITFTKGERSKLATFAADIL
jgi:PhoH-like ATPase